MAKTEKQLKLTFKVEKQVEFNEIEMGVLENGIAYLTASGLSKMCGISPGMFHKLYSEWAIEQQKRRGKVIATLLKEAGYEEDSLFIEATSDDGKTIKAFTEPVCIAMLEYYAMYADSTKSQAKQAYRALARTKFREFIYEAVGYSPKTDNMESWRNFHDRVDMTTDSVPSGYFGIFKEIAFMIVPMIRSGVMINDKTVPDGSVGGTWGPYWTKSKLHEKYGERISYDHYYPENFRQAGSNPQSAWAYPNGALGEFREWFEEVYIKSKFPKYLLGKAKKGDFEQPLVDKLLGAFDKIDKN